MCRIIILLISLILSVQCFSQTEFTTCLFDISRNRVIPIAVYQPQKVNSKTKVIIFSHGYDGNKNSKSNQTYSYLTRFFSQKSFYVISIQHELSDDPLLAMEGDFMQTVCRIGNEELTIYFLQFRNLKLETTIELERTHLDRAF